ncbi:MAG TPA: dTMP kinase [Longimicrobiaceae bacterium]|nr:dTMP kinase [Longimicrobiaceae bacterium]
MGHDASIRRREIGPDGGLFLALEGVEGSGKSTQARLLSERLHAAGFQVVHAREPGSTRLGEQVRALVLDGAELDIPPRSELFLMLAARAAFVEQVVLPALAAGRVVIADRFELSTLAYQGAGRGLPIDVVIAVNRFATGGLAPDLTLLLDLPVDEGVRRQLAAAKRPDRLESEAREFHQRVARGYLDLADEVQQLARVDASGSIEEVHERILQVLRAHFPETFAGSGVIS